MRVFKGVPVSQRLRRHHPHSFHFVGQRGRCRRRAIARPEDVAVRIFVVLLDEVEKIDARHDAKNHLLLLNLK